MSTPTNAQTLPADWLCDCKDSEIRWVDETRPHVAATGPGWICTGCLAEFLPADSLKGLEQERDRLRLIARELLADLRIVIDVARQNLPARACPHHAGNRFSPKGPEGGESSRNKSVAAVIFDRTTASNGSQDSQEAP